MSDKYIEIGEILAAARREQNKTLKEASESTKIMEHYLAAVESGKPDQLPSQAYFPLFARSYAQFLGIDPNLLEEIEEKHIDSKNSSPDNGAVETSGAERKENLHQVQARKFGKSLVYLVSAIIVIFAAVIVYIQLFMDDDRPDAIQEVEISEPAKPEQTETDILDIKAEPYQPPEKLRMRMEVKQDVWALVVRDGDTVLNRRLVAGDQRSWESDYRYRLTLGISTAVDLFVNGQKLAPLTEQARTISGLEINQVNYRDFLAPDETSSPVSSPRRSVAEQNPAESVIPAEEEDLSLPPPTDTVGKDTVDGN